MLMFCSHDHIKQIESVQIESSCVKFITNFYGYLRKPFIPNASSRYKLEHVSSHQVKDRPCPIFLPVTLVTISYNEHKKVVTISYNEHKKVVTISYNEHKKVVTISYNEHKKRKITHPRVLRGEARAHFVTCSGSWVSNSVSPHPRPLSTEVLDRTTGKLPKHQNHGMFLTLEICC